MGIACELPGRLTSLAPRAEDVRVILMDRNTTITEAMGEAQPVIAHAMAALKVVLKPNAAVKQVTATGVELTDGEMIEAATVVWCGGMWASPHYPCTSIHT